MLRIKVLQADKNNVQITDGNTISKKMKVTYNKLVVDDKCLGYRCSYYIDGEKIAYHAKIEDLRRLDCEPKESPLLTFIGDDIKILKIEDGHFYAYDELSRLVKVIDLSIDSEIIEVFGGSNKPYKKDTKNDTNMRNMLDKYKDSFISRQNKVEPEQSHCENKVKTVEKIQPTSKPNSNKIKLVRVIDKNTKDTLGIRAIEGTNTKDIPLDKLKEFNLSLDMCTETLEITKPNKKFNYDQVYNYNNTNKNLCKHYRILDVEISFEKCKLLSIQDNKVAVVNIQYILECISSRNCYITNLSKIKSWSKFI